MCIDMDPKAAWPIETLKARWANMFLRVRGLLAGPILTIAHTEIIPTHLGISRGRAGNGERYDCRVE